VKTIQFEEVAYSDFVNWTAENKEVFKIIEQG
jgi:hypothetical protein